MKYPSLSRWLLPCFLCVSIASSSLALDVKFIGMRKHRAFLQNDAGTPESKFSYAFNLTVESSTFASVIESTLKRLPTGDDLVLDFDYEDYSYDHNREDFAELEDLNAEFPAANYNLNLVTANNGTRNITLRLENSPYPPAPHISNFDAAQSINPLLNFTLRWDAFSGASTNDYISVEILDAETEEIIFQSPDIGKPGALNGKATSILIPAGKLGGEKSYSARLGFNKILTRNSTAYPGVLAVSALNSETEFAINTIIVPPQIVTHPQNRTVNIGQTVTFTVAATGTDLDYLWLHDDAILFEASGPSLTISNVQPSHAGIYKVTVSNNADSETSENAVLTVNCNFTVSLVTALFSSMESTGEIIIESVSDECQWTVENTNSWIQIQPGGTGGGEITYTVDALSGNTARFGYLKVAGKSVRVTQVPAFAPASMAGKTLAITVTNGSGAFTNTGTFLFSGLPATNQFRVSHPQATNTYTGVYAYTRIDAQTATISIGATNVSLIFTSPTGGEYAADDGAGNGQLGTFAIITPADDINLDGSSDLLFQSTPGAIAAWYMKGTNFLGSALLRQGIAATGWRAVDAADFNKDGTNDLLFQHAKNSKLAVWFMNGTSIAGSLLLRNGTAAVGWRAVTASDFDGNGSPDVLFQHTNGKLAVWRFDGVNYLGALSPVNSAGGSPGPEWRLAGAGDFNADGEVDLVFQHKDSRMAIWNFVGGKYLQSLLVRNGVAPGVAWRLVAVDHLDHDGLPDLLFENTSNRKLAMWFMNGGNLAGSALVRNGTPVAKGWATFRRK